MKTILGVDNGLLGALAFYDGRELMIYDMPVFQGDRKSIDMHKLKQIILNDLPEHVYIEKLTPMPKISGLTAFSMGNSEGLFVGLLSALNVPFTLVRPAAWKKAVQCPAEKSAARRRAGQVFPQYAHNWDLKKHDGRAEAALISLYGYSQL